MNDIAKISIGVFIGALSAIFTWEGIHMLAVKVAIEQANAKITKATTQAETNSRAWQTGQEKQRQLNAEAQQLQRLRKQDRDAAFAKFFQPTESCKNDPIQAVCANDHMKAKTVFDSQYQPSR